MSQDKITLDFLGFLEEQDYVISNAKKFLSQSNGNAAELLRVIQSSSLLKYEALKELPELPEE